jgi:hypothetical protein
MFFDRKFLSRQAYIQRSKKGSIPITSVNISKLALRLSTFYKDDVISRNSPNMLAAYKMEKNFNNY